MTPTQTAEQISQQESIKAPESHESGAEKIQQALDKCQKRFEELQKSYDAADAAAEVLESNPEMIDEESKRAISAELKSIYAAMKTAEAELKAIGVEMALQSTPERRKSPAEQPPRPKLEVVPPITEQTEPELEVFGVPEAPSVETPSVAKPDLAPVVGEEAEKQTQEKITELQADLALEKEVLVAQRKKLESLESSATQKKLSQEELTAYIQEKQRTMAEIAGAKAEIGKLERAIDKLDGVIELTDEDLIGNEVVPPPLPQETQFEMPVVDAQPVQTPEATVVEEIPAVKVEQSAPVEPVAEPTVASKAEESPTVEIPSVNPDEPQRTERQEVPAYKEDAPPEESPTVEIPALNADEPQLTERQEVPVYKQEVPTAETPKSAEELMEQKKKEHEVAEFAYYDALYNLIRVTTGKQTFSEALIKKLQKAVDAARLVQNEKAREVGEYERPDAESYAKFINESYNDLSIQSLESMLQDGEYSIDKYRDKHYNQKTKEPSTMTAYEKMDYVQNMLLNEQIKKMIEEKKRAEAGPSKESSPVTSESLEKKALEALGLDSVTSSDQARKAYRRMALLYHSDRYSGADAHDKMVALNSANAYFKAKFEAQKPDAETVMTPKYQPPEQQAAA